MVTEATEPVNNKSEKPRYRELSKKERAVAAAGSILLVAPGFWALFSTENDGTIAVAIAFVGGAVLMIMCVQGTPLVRLGARDLSMEMSPREVVRRAQELAVDSPAEARGFIQGAAAAHPETGNDPQVKRAVEDLNEQETFIDAVGNATEEAAHSYPDDRQMAKGHAIAHPIRGEGTWMTHPGAARIIVLPVYSSEPDGSVDDPCIARGIVSVLKHKAQALIIVTNAGPPGTPPRAEMGVRLQIIGEWRRERGASPILDAMSRLLDQLKKEAIDTV